MSNQQADMRQHEQEMREAFEKWFKDYSDAYDIEVGSRNYYAVMKAWNAATLAAEETFNQRLVELTSRIRDLEADATRYRWLRDKHWVQEEAEFRLNLSDTELQNVYHDELNKAIDDALTESSFTSSLERQYKENQG